MTELPPISEFEEKIRRAMDVPSADPAFVKSLGTQLASRPAKTAPRMAFRPAWALAIIVAIALLALSFPFVVAAIGRLFGYVPGMGLVENTGNLRMLAQPVSVQRDGITLTITNALVYPDRLELVYKVEGISNENDGYMAEDAVQDPTAFCGGVNIGETAIKDGDAMLRLPDGTLLEREYTGLYPQNAYSMTPVYKASLPNDVTELTMVLKCIPMARMGAVPENWEVPFKLAAVPAGTVVGLPVQDVQQPTALPTPSSPNPIATVAAAQVLPTLDVKLTFDKVVLADPRSFFYFSLNTVQPPDPSLIAIMPADVYVIDSLGQQIRLVSTGPMYPVEHPLGSLFEYFSTSQPAAGPLTLVVENAVAHYAPLYVEPRQATSEEMTFKFDAGATPLAGQSWPLDQSIEVVGYTLRVTSARAVAPSDVEETASGYDSQGYDYGYQFAVEGDPSLKISAQIQIMSDSCWPSFGAPDVPESSFLLYTEFCRIEYPKGPLSVLVTELSVLVEDTWQVTGTPQ
jgi:hypothetical protein